MRDALPKMFYNMGPVAFLS